MSNSVASVHRLQALRQRRSGGGASIPAAATRGGGSVSSRRKDTDLEESVEQCRIAAQKASALLAKREGAGSIGLKRDATRDATRDPATRDSAVGSLKALGSIRAEWERPGSAVSGAASTGIPDEGGEETSVGCDETLGPGETSVVTRKSSYSVSLTSKGTSAVRPRKCPFGDSGGTARGLEGKTGAGENRERIQNPSVAARRADGDRDDRMISDLLEWCRSESSSESGPEEEEPSSPSGAAPASPLRASDNGGRAGDELGGEELGRGSAFAAKTSPMRRSMDGADLSVDLGGEIEPGEGVDLEEDARILAEILGPGAADTPMGAGSDGSGVCGSELRRSSLEFAESSVGGDDGYSAVKARRIAKREFVLEDERKAMQLAEVENLYHAPANVLLFSVGGADFWLKVYEDYPTRKESVSIRCEAFSGEHPCIVCFSFKKRTG